MGSCPIRRVAASGLVALGVLCALLTGVFRSIDTHFHDPEVFLENTQQLADNAGVRERLFDGFRAEIIAIADGVDLNADAEPEPDDAEDAPFDSDIVQEPAEVDTTIPITDERIERDQAIEAILLDVFDSEEYQLVFDEQLRSVQQQVLRSAELPDEALLRDPGQVSFDARRLYQPIYAALAADPKTAEITQNEVPAGYGVFPIADRETTINAGWWLVENGPGWRGLTYAVAILSFIGAVVVAERRPTRAIQFGAGIIGLAAVVIVVVYILRALVPLLASGSGDAAVTAVYAANTDPVVGSMIRLLVVGVVLAVVGGIAKLIWPDDWVYGHVADDRGVRSIRRRRGAAQAQTPQAAPAAAAAPTMYPGYPQPYGYPPASPYPGQPYPGQPYPAPHYAQPYPAGPYAQPVPQGYAAGARGTVPAIPVGSDVVPTGENLAVRPDAGMERPSDAAGAVPRVVAAADSTASASRATVSDDVDEPTAPHKTTGSEPVEPPSSGEGDAWDNDGDW